MSKVKGKKKAPRLATKPLSYLKGAREKIEVNLKDQPNKQVLAFQDHFTIPGLNFNKKPWVEQQWDPEHAFNLYRPYPFTCDLPKPLLPPARVRRHIYTKSDPATDLIFIKKYIKDDMETILEHFDNHPDEYTLPSKKDVVWSGVKYHRGETVVRRYVADLADIIETDPDPYFEGRYNWYYTGGSISNLHFNNMNLLIFPFMKDLVVSPIDFKGNGLWKPNLRKATKSTIDNPLYEIRHLVLDDSCRILARCKFECIFYSLTRPLNNLTIVTLDTRKTEHKPYVSADLNHVDHNQYCTLNVERTLLRCDMVSGKSFSKGHVNPKKVLPDNWGSIKYHPTNSNIIVYTDREALQYLDLRVSLEIPTLTMCPKNKLDICDLLSLHLPSERASRHYLGTYHSFVMVDDRCLNQCVHQKWTHQFRSPPLNGATYMRDGEEFIVISSQQASEKAVIINTWKEYDDPHSYHLPHTTPSILNTLKQSQSLGTCLDPTLSTRCEMSTVGSTLMPYDNDIYYFNQSSMEDVFYSCITHKEREKNIDLINDYAGHALKSWEQEMLKSQEKFVLPVAVTDRFNMQHIVDKFGDTELKYEVHDEENFLPDYWRQPIWKLKEYKDLMAQPLLAPWEFQDELSTELKVDFNNPDNSRVFDWLRTAHETALPVEDENLSSQPLDDDQFPFTPVSTQDLVSVSQQPVDPEIRIKEEEIELLDDHEAMMTAMRNCNIKKGKKKAKSNYTDGF